MTDPDALTDEQIDHIIERELEQTPDEGAHHCPVCDSTELYLELGGETGYKYHCKRCDYMGAFVVRHPDDEPLVVGDGSH